MVAALVARITVVDMSRGRRCGAMIVSYFDARGDDVAPEGLGGAYVDGGVNAHVSVVGVHGKGGGCW